jgi:hypothetical protein
MVNVAGGGKSFRRFIYLCELVEEGSHRVPLASFHFPCEMFPSGRTTCSKGVTRLFIELGRCQTPRVNNPPGDIVGDSGPLRNKVTSLLHAT